MVLSSSFKNVDSFKISSILKLPHFFHLLEDYSALILICIKKCQFGVAGKNELAEIEKNIAYFPSIVVLKLVQLTSYLAYNGSCHDDSIQFLVLA